MAFYLLNHLPSLQDFISNISRSSDAQGIYTFVDNCSLTVTWVSSLAPLLTIKTHSPHSFASVFQLIILLETHSSHLSFFVLSIYRLLFQNGIIKYLKTKEAESVSTECPDTCQSFNPEQLPRSLTAI